MPGLNLVTNFLLIEFYPASKTDQPLSCTSRLWLVFLVRNKNLRQGSRSWSEVSHILLLPPPTQLYGVIDIAPESSTVQLYSVYRTEDRLSVYNTQFTVYTLCVIIINITAGGCAANNVQNLSA